MAFRTCAWCGDPFSVAVRPGPTPRYCRPSHRQRAYESRKRSRAAPDEMGTGASSSENRGPGFRDGIFIRILGPVEVTGTGGSPIPLGPALRGVLGALARRPREVVSHEKLVDEIWPGVPDGPAKRRLHTAVWKLRTLIGEGDPATGRRILASSPTGYSLEVSDDQLDWARFRRLRLAGERALQQNQPLLAKSYLEDALVMWRGTDVLAGIDLPSDALGFVAERNAGRERAVRALLAARFRLGDQVIPELEALVASDPSDDEAVRQLAVAYYRVGEVARALEACARYLKRSAETNGNHSARIAELQSRILRDEVELPRVDVSPNGRPFGRIFLSAAWDARRLALGPLPAELHLVLEEHGGRILEASDVAVDATFLEVRSALSAALALQDAIGDPGVRCGITIHDFAETSQPVEGVAQARSRLLAAAAHPGQILVTGGDSASPDDLPSKARLRSLGSHRLNALGPAVRVRQLLSPDHPAVGSTPRWFDRSPVHNLVPEASRFIGREKEVAETTDALIEHRCVTLFGAPGSGKTRLATHVANGLTGEYQDGVWFVPLQPLPQTGLVASTIAEILRIPRPTAVHVGTLASYLAEKRALIVLDNCEHLLPECRELIGALLAACPGLSVLATSRETLRTRYEKAIHVAPLEPPSPAERAALLDNDAVRLYLDRLQPDHEISPEETDAIGRICRAVEGIPLALVVAAGRASEVGSVALAEALGSTLGEGAGLGILSGPSSGTYVDHDTLDGTLEWSYRLLDDRERPLFDSLSVFRGRFCLDDTIAVCAERSLSRADVVTGVDRLVQNCLVASEDHGRRFRLLQPVREFAAGKLAIKRRRASTVRRRHAEHFLRVAEEAEPFIHGPQDRVTLVQMDASLPDLYAAVRWAVSAGDSNVAYRLVGVLWVYWLVRGRILEGRDLAEQVLTLDPSPSPERIKALKAFAHLSWFSGDFQRALDANREVLNASELIGDEWGWAMAAVGFAAVRMFGSDPEDGVLLRLEEVMPKLYELGNAWDTCQALQTLAGTAWHRGQYERAERAMAEAVEVYRSVGHPTFMASLRVHGLMLAILGRTDAGAAEVDHSLAVTYEDGDLSGLSEALCCRAAIARYSGDHDLARRYYRDALRAASDGGNGWMLQWALSGLGDTEELGLHVPPERLEAAVQFMARADALAEETGIRLAPREREAHAGDLERARARLGEEAFAAAYERGRNLDINEAIARSFLGTESVAYATD